MAIALNLSGNGIFGAPGGYPIKLSAIGQTAITAVVPKGTASISVAAYADKQADLHLAIYAMPSTVGGADGAVITDLDTSGVVVKTYQADLAGLLAISQTLTLAMPTTKAPAPYVVRAWVDNIVGTTLDTVDRDSDGLTSDEAPKPVGVNISKVSVT